MLRGAGQMSAPAAHSILWGVWRSGWRGPLAATFEAWRAEKADLDDLVGAVDLLLMEAEWRRGGNEGACLEMLEASTPHQHVQGVISKWARGYVAAESIAVHLWDREKVERNRPELAKCMGHFPEMSRWAQPGSGNHWRKLGSLVEHVDALVDVVTSSSMPMSMIQLIERFAEGARQWLKVAGGAKADVLRGAVHQRRWWPWEFLLECGAFIGYTSVRLTVALQEALGSGARVVTVEVDPVQACIARHFIDLAGCARSVEVWIGQFRDVLGRSVEELGARALGFVFLDYRGTVFHLDLEALERLTAPAPDGIAVADNVVLPGAPLYLWRMTRHPAWSTMVWALQEFLEPGVEDWMCVSSYKAPLFPEVPAPPPGWTRLSWHTDHMRRRAQGMRPGERGMTEEDRSSYAEEIRTTYRAAGIEAAAWAGSAPQQQQRVRFERRLGGGAAEEGADGGRPHIWPVWGQGLT